MGIMIQTPRITGGSDRERLQQIQSYLYQMAQQLQWAFDTIQVGTGGNTQSPIQQSKTTYVPAKQDPDKTFAALKDLIIKSAEIVDAYYEEISSRLEGIYVAQSDFGTYTEETALELRQNSSGIQQIYENVRSVSDSLEELYSTTLGTNAYLKSGLLEETDSGVPVYGLEIGQTNTKNGTAVFNRFARFSADRLSFFDSNDAEVAYISDYRLCITKAEISGDLLLGGRFKLWCNGGLAFQWMGGNS